MNAQMKAIHIDIPVNLAQVKVVFSIASLSFEGDLTSPTRQHAMRSNLFIPTPTRAKAVNHVPSIRPGVGERLVHNGTPNARPPCNTDKAQPAKAPQEARYSLAPPATAPGGC